MRRITRLLFLSVAIGIAVAVASPAADSDGHWPQWRGPLADGVAPTGNPPVEWGPDKNIKWKVAIPGSGSATPIVWGETMFIVSAVPTDRPAPRNAQPPAEPAPAPGAKPRPPTPARRLEPQCHHHVGVELSGDRRTDGLRLLRLARALCAGHEGQREVGARLRRHQHRRFRRGSSPALDGDRLVVTWDHLGESFIVALDKNSGKELWRTARDEKTTYSTPLIVEHRGRKQIITAGMTKVRSYDLADGKLLWEGPGLTTSPVASPVHANGVVYLMSGYGGSALYAVRLAHANGDITTNEQAIAWKYNRDTPWVPSPLLYGNELYFLKMNSGILSVFNATTGEKLYGEQRLDGLPGVYASPVGAAGCVYIAGREGAVAVIQRGPQFKLLALNQLDDGFDASPVVVGDELYLRGTKHLYRISKN
jgi:outer membrane protein assembly factor BamB